MAVLNVRVDDHVRDQLKELADEEGVTLSEYVRDILLAAVVPVWAGELRHGDEPAPESMRLIDRKTLSLLHRILGQVLPENANGEDGDIEYQLERAKILEAGYTAEYWKQVAGFRTELSRRDCGRVSDILQMFRILTFSTTRLSESGEPIDEKLENRLKFRGFDHNDPLEGHMASYVEHLMGDGRWEELKPYAVASDNGNSHSPVLDVYSRMLTEYRKVMDGRGQGFDLNDYFLTREELERIAEARVHPSKRNVSG